MLTRTKTLIAAGALVMELPAGAALAETVDDDLPVTTVTCDGTQQQLQRADGSGPGGGDCINGEPGEQTKVMLQKQLHKQLQNGECDGDGEQRGNGPGDGLAAGGYGPGDGDKTGQGPMNGQGKRNRASS